MDRCPYCGSKTGIYKTYVGIQYYDWSGEPSGFNDDMVEKQRMFVKCIKCHKRISMKRILESNNE